MTQKTRFNKKHEPPEPKNDFYGQYERQAWQYPKPKPLKIDPYIDTHHGLIGQEVVDDPYDDRPRKRNGK